MVLFASVALVSSCSKDESNPPTAGFGYNTTDVIQYDKVVFISTSNADDISYEISGGNVSIDNVDGTVQFLEAKDYTVVQTAKNSDGSTTATEVISVSAPNNTHKMTTYGGDAALVGDAYWFSSRGVVQIRIVAEGVTAQETANLVKVTPVLGVDPIEGDGSRSYTWSTEGDAGTYDVGFTHYPETGDAWDAAWMMPTTSGDGLDVTLVYKAADEADNVYDITVKNTSMSGYYDGGFSSHEEVSVLTLTYRGVIIPLIEE